MKTRKIKIIALLSLLVALSAPSQAFADHCNTLSTPLLQQECLQFPEEYHTNETVDFSPQGGQLDTDGGEPIEENPIYQRLNEIINVLSVGVGIVVTASVVYAGIQYITSRGDPNKTQAAVKRIVQAGIALALYIFGWTILNWLIPGGVLG